MATRRYFGTTWRRRPTKGGSPSLVIEHDDGEGRPVGMATANAADPKASEAHADLMAAGPEMYQCLVNVRTLLRSATLRATIEASPGPVAVPDAGLRLNSNDVADSLDVILAEVGRVLAKADGRS